ncbi:hypothetical protein PAHAL_9G131900 [Panicum hallii]|uniref:Glycine-rich protein n=1 Tax=Panicum hallii TaxID=206008 RepID=A0A2S3IJB0_9POAL|nr:uncharacterized protein LOC112875445 isoform X2 [Panicum hallii]PAN45635.1 hypothetical protein PAHAL_9G131900 [Panicum hallii]
MAASPTASSSSAPTAAAAAAAAEATDGPVLSVVSKRLRALRKKYNRITQMEESLAAGKTLNREQEEVLRSKPVVAALIEELERLRAPLASAVAEELSSRPAPAAPAPAAAAAAAASSSDSDSSIQDLLALVYFGSLFDVKLQHDFVATMVARTHERNCCITYDYVTDDAADLLVEADLDAVSTLASLAASRPAAAVGVSHRDALQACAHHARLWLRRADEPIHPDSTVTYAGVRAKLERIMSSDYYTARTEIRATEDLAASVGSYGPGGGQAQESMVVSPQAPEAVEESLVVEGHKDEKEESQATEIYTDNQAPAVDAQHDDDALVNPPDEVPSAEAEQERFEADLEDQEQKDQQFVQRRSYQNQRGGGRGGRRGYPNGRGGRGGRGGGYQNGRGGGGYQNGRGGGGGYYYDSGYYQPRNYNNNRGRGGRSGGGNSYYNNHGGGAQGGGHGNPGRVELGANA